MQAKFLKTNLQRVDLATDQAEFITGIVCFLTADLQSTVSCTDELRVL